MSNLSFPFVEIKEEIQELNQKSNFSHAYLPCQYDCQPGESKNNDQLSHFVDEKEDACTQTDIYTFRRPDNNQGVAEVNKLGSEGLKSPNPAIDRDEMSTMELMSPLTEASYHESNKSRSSTLNSLMTMKEKHRENERLRHHTLNQHLRDICKNVPGTAEEGKDTKVVMMQRIISYICYLENTIKCMCSQLNQETESSWLLLTSSVKDIEKSGTWKKEFLSFTSKESAIKKSKVIKKVRSRVLKLSSPTIDSTTETYIDAVSLQTRPVSSTATKVDLCGVKSEKITDTTKNYYEKVQSSGDSVVPSSCFDADDPIRDKKSEKGPIIVSSSPSAGDLIVPLDEENEPFDALLRSPSYDDQSFYELPLSTNDSIISKSPEGIQWLVSPNQSPNDESSSFGIHFDPIEIGDDPQMDMAHTVLVAPDQVLPNQTFIKTEPMETEWEPPTSAGGEPQSAVAYGFHDYACVKARDKNERGLLSSQMETSIDCTKNELPTSTEDKYSDACNLDQLVPHLNRFKHQSPNRGPLKNITNWPETVLKFSETFASPSECDTRNHVPNGDFLNQELEIGNFEEVVSSTNYEELNEIADSVDDVDENELDLECEKVLREANSMAPAKMDLRRSSWMNGFMMFSRIHRRRFIRKNPKMLTSRISKILGHTWRSMTQAQQHPYTEKARVCSEELQKMLEENRLLTY